MLLPGNFSYGCSKEFINVFHVLKHFPTIKQALHRKSPTIQLQNL